MNLPGVPPEFQARLLQTEDGFRLLFEDAPVAYHEVDIEGRITRVNRAECAMFGYDRSELIGKHVCDLVPPEDRDYCREAISRKLVAAEGIPPIARRFLRKNGEQITIELYQNLIEDERGGIAGIRGILIDVTEREQAMKAAPASEAKYRDLLDNVIDGIYQSTPEGKLLTANPALVKMLGYQSRTEFLRVDIKTLYVHPERRAACMVRLERDGELRNCELELRTRDGRVVTVLENARAVRDSSGAVCYYEGVLTDITGRVEAEAALTRERDFSSAIIETAGNPIVVLDPHGRIVRFNRVCEQISGYSFDEVSGRRLWDILIVPEEIPPLKDVFDRLWRGESPIEHENHWRTRAGDLRLIDWSNVALRDKNGAAVHIIGTGVDITGQRTSEEALKASEQRYRDLFENANDIVYTHDLRGNFTSINSAGEKVTGYSRAEMLRMNMSHLAAPGALADFRGRITANPGGEGPTTDEFDIFAKDGRRVSLEVGARLQMKDGKPVGVYGIARDITDRKLAEEKLESYAHEMARKNEELAGALAAAREVTELKGRFLATMSHEIRTPLNGILGMTELLMSTPLDAEQREYSEAVRHSAEALLTVINDILDISRIEAGKLEIESLPFDPASVVDQVVGLLAPRAAAQGLRLESEMKVGLPRIVIGDAGRVRQILLNLVGNAVKFTAAGEVVVTVEPAGDSAETAPVRFSVRDTGIGIDPADHPRLFQIFVQGDSSTTRKYGGTGLGLAISRQLAEMMGGAIEVESELGRGSTFSFLIPFGKYHP